MSMIRCLRRSAAADRADNATRKRLEHTYSVAYADAIDSHVGAGEAERLANAAFDNTLTTIRHESRVARTMQAEAEERLIQDASTFRNDKNEPDIGEFSIRKVNDVHFRAQALFQYDQAQMASVGHEFQRTAVRGQRLNHRRADLMIDEIFGVDTGDLAARVLAEEVNGVMKSKVEQFNGAGGNIAPLERYVPQKHDAITIMNAGYDTWRARIMDTVDWEKITNTDTGRPFTAREFDAALPDIFDTIVKHGMGEQDAGLMGERSMALWKRRNDARFFVFKDADAWRRYHAKFGGGMHPYEMLTGYLRSINHDIAAMQMLGPNPTRSIKLLAGPSEFEVDGLIMHHAARADKQDPTALFPTTSDQVTLKSATTERFNAPFRNWKQREQYARNKAVATHRAWDAFTGRARKPLNDGWAYANATVDTAIYAAKLPFTSFLVGGDIANQAATRAFISPGMQSMMRDLVDAFRISGDRKLQAELAIEFDTGLSTMLSEARDHLSVHGSPTVRWVTDRTMTFTALKPMTMGMRAAWTLGILHDIARHIGKSYDRLPMRDFLARHGIDANAWEFIQAAPVHTAYGRPIIRPADIAGVDIFSLRTDGGEIGESIKARPGLTRGQEVAIRLLQAIKQEGEYAVVSGTPRSAATLPYRPGSLSGFAIGSMARLKTYSISHWQHHAYRAMSIFHANGGGIRGMAGAARYYGWSLLIPSMFLVGAGTTLADMASGKNPPDITSARFWNRVFWKTVSLGFFQDTLQGSFDDAGANPVQRASRWAGPTASVYSDVGTAALDAGGVGINSLRRVFGDDVPEDADPRAGRSAIRAARDFVPRTWATDIAVDRLAWDNFQRMVDPDAEEDFANRARRVNQGMWAAPGQPLQAPDLSTLDLQAQHDDPP